MFRPHSVSVAGTIAVDVATGWVVAEGCVTVAVGMWRYCEQKAVASACRRSKLTAPLTSPQDGWKRLLKPASWRSVRGRAETLAMAAKSRPTASMVEVRGGDRGSDRVVDERHRSEKRAKVGSVQIGNRRMAFRMDHACLVLIAALTAGQRSQRRSTNALCDATDSQLAERIAGRQRIGFRMFGTE